MKKVVSLDDDDDDDALHKVDLILASVYLFIDGRMENPCLTDYFLLLPCFYAISQKFAEAIVIPLATLSVVVSIGQRLEFGVHDRKEIQPELQSWNKWSDEWELERIQAMNHSIDSFQSVSASLCLVSGDEGADAC
jgi:hypothetical protein